MLLAIPLSCWNFGASFLEMLTDVQIILKWIIHDTFLIFLAQFMNSFITEVIIYGRSSNVSPPRDPMGSLGPKWWQINKREGQGVGIVIHCKNHCWTYLFFVFCLRHCACLHEYPLSDIPAKLCSPVCEIEGGPVWLLRQFAVSCCPVIALEKQPCWTLCRFSPVAHATISVGFRDRIPWKLWGIAAGLCFWDKS